MSTKYRALLCCALFSLAAAPSVWAASDQPPPEADQGGVQWEYYGIVKNETAMFTRDGQVTNQAATVNDNDHHDGGDLLKFENSVNLHVNAQFTEATSAHAQFNLVYDTEGSEQKFRGHNTYSQNDYVRELYLDTSLGEVDFRLGKQQEVWGTADGIKLLDILNPTDYREFVQNTMEDSRIPVWMLKGSAHIGSNGNLQMVVAQREENMIPGLGQSGDPNHPFIMKGVDSITGNVYGFKNIAPELGEVAGTFDGLAQNFALPGLLPIPAFNLATTTVQDFIDGSSLAAAFGAACPGFGAAYGTSAQNADCLDSIVQTTNNNKTFLIDGGSWNENDPNSAFEYMNNATFATFNTFVGVRTNYERDYPSEYSPNLGMRYKDTIGANFNYSLNYLNHYDANPYIDLSWENGQGRKLTRLRSVDAGTGLTTIHLQDADGNYYGAADPTNFARINRPATLVFTEKLNRINSLGGSFDTSVETGLMGPVVLRGEALYQIDTKTPVMNRTLLSQGDLVGALQSEDADMFKYVLGAEFIALTNLTISGQFIQFVNLDYVDQNGDGTANSGRYTADGSVMHLTNGMRKAEEFKEFYSLFLSKPFGEEQEGRVNNITMFEENGGWWNRLDGEWKFNDNWVGTAEWNQYWGNEETMFGQFGESSNVQLGVKYIF